MSVLSKEEFENLIRSRVGEDTSDDSIKFIEDAMDTYNHLESESGTDWKQKFEQNDADWRKKYTDRFFSGSNNDNDNTDDNIDVPDTPKEKTFEELFKEEK